MELKNLLLEQLEREASASRKVVERVPEGRNGWKPHAKSMELGYLAALVASMTAWPAMMIDTEELDLNGPHSFRPTPMTTAADLVERLDKSLADSRRALENTTEEHLLKVWRLKAGPQVLAENIRYVAIINDALSHMAHHRGQLTVYLRLNEAKVPAIFGPSADEQYSSEAPLV